MKPALIALAKLAVSAILIAVVVRAFDVRGALERIASAGPVDTLMALALAAAILPLQTLRWKVVLRESGHELPFARALGLVWIGQFFSQVLPSSVGGDALRMWYAHKSGMAPGPAIVTVIVDRVVSLLGILVLVAGGLPWLLRAMPEGAARTGIVVLVAAGVAGFAVVALFAADAPWLHRWRPARVLLAPWVLLRRILLAPRRLAFALASSVAGTAGFCAVVFQLGRALGLELGLADCLLLFPPVMLATAIPISVAGWGLREGAMVVVLGYVHVAAADAFALSVLFGLVVIVASLPGVAFWLARGDAAGSLSQAARFDSTRG